MWNIFILTAVLGSVRCQFMLVWNTGEPSTPPSLGPGGFDINCKDKEPNCKAYGEDGCKAPYDIWAKTHCANTCGFCIGPTDPPPPCQDKINSCDSYGHTVCTDPTYKSWAQDNCRYFCRKCPPDQLAVIDSHTTTIAPADCKDKVDCRLYGQKGCTGEYAKWAKTNCPVYCGICKGVATPAPACEDKIPNCSSYKKETCTDPNFGIWVDDHCRKYCGKCGGGSIPVHATNPPYPVPPRPVKRGDH